MKALSVVLSGTNFKTPLSRKIMKLRQLAVALVLLVSCAVAGAADRKYIVKPRPADRKRCLSAMAFWSVTRSTLRGTSGRIPNRPGTR